MTADEARKLTSRFKDDTGEKVQVVVQQWNQLIAQAARDGRERVTEDELPRLRMPIPLVAFALARGVLVQRGFVVRQIKTGPNEDTWEVSWPSEVLR